MKMEEVRAKHPAFLASELTLSRNGKEDLTISRFQIPSLVKVFSYIHCRPFSAETFESQLCAQHKKLNNVPHSIPSFSQRFSSLINRLMKQSRKIN